MPDGSNLPAFHAVAAVTASATDFVTGLPALVAGKRIRVVSFILSPAAASTTVTFNSKGSGSGTAISAVITTLATASTVAPYEPSGWFETNVGEALSITTGAGSTVGVQLNYELVA